MDENYISIADAEKISGVDSTTIWRWCKSGKIDYQEVPDKKSRGGRKFFVSRSAILKKTLEGSGQAKTVKDIEKKQEENKKQNEVGSNSDEEIQKKVESLHLSQTEAERLKVTLKGFNKADVERVLKTEQALSKQKDNVLRDGRYIEKEKVGEQISHVFSVFGRSLKDIFPIWEKKYNLDNVVMTEMQIDLNSLIAKAIKELRQI